MSSKNLETTQNTNLGVSSAILESAWDLVHPGQNRDVREILRNLIGCLEYWELENTDFSQKIKTPDWCIDNINVFLKLNPRRLPVYLS